MSAVLTADGAMTYFNIVPSTGARDDVPGDVTSRLRRGPPGVIAELSTRPYIGDEGQSFYCRMRRRDMQLFPIDREWIDLRYILPWDAYEEHGIDLTWDGDSWVMLGYVPTRGSSNEMLFFRRFVLD